MTTLPLLPVVPSSFAFAVLAIDTPTDAAPDFSALHAAALDALDALDAVATCLYAPRAEWFTVLPRAHASPVAFL